MATSKEVVAVLMQMDNETLRRRIVQVEAMLADRAKQDEIQAFAQKKFNKPVKDMEKAGRDIVKMCRMILADRGVRQ